MKTISLNLKILTREQEEKQDLKQKLTLITNELNDTRTDMAKSQDKQNELLAYTSKLTEKNTQLQSENTSLVERLEQCETELKTFKEQNGILNDRINADVSLL